MFHWFRFLQQGVFLKSTVETGEKTRLLRVHTVLEEDPSSLPRTHVGCLQLPVTLTPLASKAPRLMYRHTDNFKNQNLLKNPL